MKNNRTTKLTLSVHAGSHGDPLYHGRVTPIYPSSAYDYEKEVLYPRYYNTPNQQAVAEKMAAIENGEAALVLSSGMAAIMTSLLSVARNGDHILFQSDLYGGTQHAALKELARYGIDHSLSDVGDLTAFEQSIRKNTKVIYVETPSNPLLKITDLAGVVRIARRHGVTTIIDNTFASPVNQNPLDLGIDIVTHSGTKYIGGHSDLCCGIIVSDKNWIDTIRGTGLNLGGSLDAYTCYLVERSLKTIVLRVRQQNQSALAIAEFLESEKTVKKVNYPGLKSHPSYRVARKQMPGGFGGMLSFEIAGDPEKLMKKLKFIRRAVSLGGVESTINTPARTSHAKLTAQGRKEVGISDKLLRLSVGIEDTNELIDDLKQAL